MASGNDTSASASSKVLPSLLSYGEQLAPEWKALATSDERVYFVNHRTRSTHWFPPPEFWTSKLGLPYGWEEALDGQNRKYYINHVTRTTTREDPRSEADQATHFHMTPTQARRIELIRDETIGFGFVAGSEKPVVIRSVIPDGPSFNKLYANDQILKVNGMDVRDSPQGDVISLIKSSVDRIEVEVIASDDVQDTKNKRNRKSSLMSRTTRERRRSTPVSVRFADEPALVQVIGPMEPVRRCSVPLIPNVLKVFLENGQTRSFRYDCNTTVEEIFRSFASKLDLRSMEHFSLVLTGPRKGQISYIQNQEKISEIYTNRNCSSVNCLCKLNIAFVPKDHFELLLQDPNAFEYLYSQVANMSVEGFYGMDLKYDLAIKLAALQIQQKAIEAACGRPVKISVRQVEKEFGGLSKFVSSDLLHNMKQKELRKALDQQIKHNESLASPGERHMSSLQCKIHYLNLAAEIFSYGGRYFDAVLVHSGNIGPSLKSKKQHITVLVNMKHGVSQVVRGKVNVLFQLAEFHEIKGFKISLCEDNKRLLRIRLQDGKEVQLICTSRHCTDMIALITGYYKVYVDNTSSTPLPVENEEKWPFSFRRDDQANDAPEFCSRHHVVPDVWSYPSRFQTLNAKNKSQVESTTPLKGQKELFVDLSRTPPRYHETAISEEPVEDHFVTREVELKTLDQVSVINKASRSLSPQSEDNADNDDDSPNFIMTQDDYNVFEKASSVLKASAKNIDSVSHKTLDDICNGDETWWDNEELVESRKRYRASSEISDKDGSDRKSVRTAVGDDFHSDKIDFIPELVPREGNWKNESTGVTVFDEREGEESISDTKSLRSVTTDGSSSGLVLTINSEEHNTHTVSAADETDSVEKITGTPDRLSSEDDSYQHQPFEKELENAGFIDNGLRSRPKRSSTDSLVSHRSEETSFLCKCDGNTLAFSEEDVNLQSAQDQYPFISTDPLSDRISTAIRHLESVESKFDNMGIDQMDYTEGEIAFGGFDKKESLEDNLNSTEPAVDYIEPKGSNLIDCASSESDTSNEHQDFDSLKESELSLVVLSEFVESSDSETASEISEGEESLFSAFPEFFQPSRRLKYSSSKDGILSLAEEDQLEDDMDDLSYQESDQDHVPVSLTKFRTKDDLDTLSPTNKIIDTGSENDWEELSTTSSENTECSYEINAELKPQDSERKCNSFPLYGKEKQQACELHDDASDLIPVSLISLNDRRSEISLDTHSSSNDEEVRVEESSPSLAGDKVVSFSYDKMNLNEKESIAETPESVVSEEPDMLLESSSVNDAGAGSGPLFDQSLQHIPEFRSLSNCSDKNDPTWEETESCLSPSAWIIPSPPTPTPELQEDDIHVVSPPPADTVTYDDELDKELEDLIVPPPPLAGTVHTISDIRIASPPPSPPSQVTNSNVIDDFICDYDEIRFLSSTDHKLAHNKGLRVYFTEDKKNQTQSVETHGLFVSKGRFHASKSAPSICGTYQDNNSAKSYSVAPVKQKPSVPPKPRYLQSTKNKSRVKRYNTISVKGMDASMNAKHVVKREGNANMARTLNEPEQGLNPLHSKADLSLSQINNESLLKDSNNNDKCTVSSQSQVQAPDQALGEVMGPDSGGDVKSSECKVELPLDFVVEADSMSADKRPKAFHPPYVFSTLATSEDVLTMKETSEQSEGSGMGRSFKLMHKFPNAPSRYSLTRPPHSLHSSKNACESLSIKRSVDFNENVNDYLLLLSTSPPSPDSFPPPLPETSPPKTMVGFNEDDFDFGEPLSDTFEDYGQSYGREDNGFDLPSSAKELKSKRTLEYFYRKRCSFTDSLLKTEGKTCASTYYVSVSSPPGVNRRSLSEDTLQLGHEVSCTSKTKSRSFSVSQNRKLGDGSDSCSDLEFLEQHRTNSLETKCSRVCEEGLSRVGKFRKRLESCLKEGLTIVKLPDERMNWLLVLQNNARFLACDVKVIVSSVRRGSAQVVSAIQASLDSLEKLVESCEKANSTVNDNTTSNFSTMVSMVIEVVKHCGDIIASVEPTVDGQPNDSGVESLTEKANVLGTLIASLIRKIRKG